MIIARVEIGRPRASGKAGCLHRLETSPCLPLNRSPRSGNINCRWKGKLLDVHHRTSGSVGAGSKSLSATSLALTAFIVPLKISAFSVAVCRRSPSHIPK